MKIGFIVWNPFQLIQFKSITDKFENSTIFIIDKDNNRRLFSKNLLTSGNWKVEYIKPNDVPLIDGTQDVILFQSAFPNIEKIKISKLVSIQYGLAKERHNYGEWRALADMNLMYGEYSVAAVEHFAPSYPIGNPKFDTWNDYITKFSDKRKLYKDLKLDSNKKTILYMPTWGELGSFTDLLPEISRLQSKYNIILKMHHNNDAKTPEWLVSAKEYSLKYIFDGSADQLKLICACDLVISDFSGAIFDGMFAEKPLLLYQAGIDKKVGIQKFELESLEFSKRDEIGHVCMNISDFESSIEYCLNNSSAVIKKSSILRSKLFYQDDNKNASELCHHYINKLYDGSIPVLTQSQKYVRESVQDLRVCKPRLNRLEKIVKNRNRPFIKKMVGFLSKSK